MAADVFRLQELLYADEASFLENANSLTSNVFDERVPFLDATVTLEQSRVSDQTVQARKNESRPGYLSIRRATLEFSCYVPGAMTDPGTGAPSTNWFADLLGAGIGSKLLTDDGGTVNSSTDGDTFVTTGVTTITAGTVIRVGAKGDGRADGQAGVVSTWSGGNTQLLTAVAGTPTAADAVRTCINVYPTETNPSTSYRFLMMHKTSGAFYQMIGCRLDSVTFEFPVQDGGLIKATFRYMGAYWDLATPSSPSSFPSSVSMPNCDTAVISGGSFFENSFGTATRAIKNISSLTLTLNMGLIPEVGPAASQPQFCNIYGWVSRGCVPTITYTAPWTSTGHTGFDTDGSSTTHLHHLFTSSNAHGRTFGFYLPRTYWTGNRPTRENVNDLLHQQYTFTGRESTDTTSELTRSAIRFFQG